jgi:hypothetical protein
LFLESTSSRLSVLIAVSNFLILVSSDIIPVYQVLITVSTNIIPVRLKTLAALSLPLNEYYYQNYFIF